MNGYIPESNITATLIIRRGLMFGASFAIGLVWPNYGAVGFCVLIILISFIPDFKEGYNLFKG